MLEEGGQRRSLDDSDDDHDEKGLFHKETNDNNSNKNYDTPPSPTVARMPPQPPSVSSSSFAAGSKRNREGGKLSSFRRSIFRVGSRIDRRSNDNNKINSSMIGSSSDTNGVPHSPRARASTYSHVHDAVMYNLSEAETSKHDQTVPMGTCAEHLTLG
jgi:hypothetical protein